MRDPKLRLAWTGHIGGWASAPGRAGRDLARPESVLTGHSSRPHAGRHVRALAARSVTGFCADRGSDDLQMSVAARDP
jgi:hypothetical protein